MLPSSSKKSIVSSSSKSFPPVLSGVKGDSISPQCSVKRRNEMKASAGGTGIGNSGDVYDSSPIVDRRSLFLAEYSSIQDGKKVGIHTKPIHQPRFDRRALCVGATGMVVNCVINQMDLVA